MIHPIQAFLREPRPPAGPRRTRWDYAFVIVLGALTALGAPFEDEVALRPVAGAVGLILVLALWWRRSHPFLAVAVPFALLLVAEATASATSDGSTLLAAGFVVSMILIYSVWRWGSGREAVVALAIVLISVGAVDVNLDAPREEALGSVAVISLWAAIGAVMRSQARLRQQTISEARLHERERLARELHDTVAHHVSAVAVQAQAGQAIVMGDPGRGQEVLRTIEQVANVTLDEMRHMVGVLRDRDGDRLRPPAATGIAGIRRLTESASGPKTQLEILGDVDDLRAPLAAGLYRLVQESLTNARRHSRAATKIQVTIRGTDDAIELSVVDDGSPTIAPTEGDGGFGLVGMSERVAMLGGTLSAKPGRRRGWVVAATLPRDPHDGETQAQTTQTANQAR